MAVLKKYPKLLGLLLLCLVLAGGGYYYYHYVRYPRPYDERLNEERNGTIGYFMDDQLNQSALVGETGILVSTSGNTESTSKYVIGQRIGLQKMYVYLESSEELYPDDYFYVDVYSANGGELLKTINILKLIQTHSPTYIPTVSVDVLTSQANGRSYLKLSVSQGRNGARKRFVIDIETEEVTEVDIPLDGYELGAPSLLTSVFSSKVTDVHKKLRSRHISLDYGYGISPDPMDILGFKFSKKSQVKDLKLTKEYPDTIPVIKENGILQGFNQESSKELARLLGTEDETDVFQGVTLYGEYSKDGKDRVVQSYDDLMAWYQEPTKTNIVDRKGNYDVQTIE